MKLYYFSLVLCALALGGCGRGASSDTKSACDVAYENIMTRTSIRQYTSEPVSSGAVDSLLHAGMAAPTAANKQPWTFLVIDLREMLDSISTMSPGWAPVGRAPMAIVVCGDTDKALAGEAADYWIQDCSAVSENILLAAHALGLGAVWCGVYPVKDNVESLSGYLRMMPNIIPLSIIAVGHPAENPTPKDKFDSSAVAFNRW